VRQINFNQRRKGNEFRYTILLFLQQEQVLAATRRGLIRAEQLGCRSPSASRYFLTEGHVGPFFDRSSFDAALSNKSRQIF
jgi:hypothetical protein